MLCGKTDVKQTIIVAAIHTGIIWMLEEIGQTGGGSISPL
jgi:hypothetical protein